MSASTALHARNQLKLVRREAREQELAAAIQVASRAVGKQLYGVLYVDPPWRFEPRSRVTGMDRAADNHYPTLTAEAIKALKVPTAKDCAMFLWATSPMLPQAESVMAAWGFGYRSHCIWLKDRIGTGYWFRNQHEVLLLGVRGRVTAPAPGTQFPSVAAAPRGKHSEKPAVFAEMIEQMFPTVPKLEMFQRGAVRPGWDVWGAEAGSTPLITDSPSTSSAPIPSTAAGSRGAPASPAGVQ